MNYLEELKNKPSVKNIERKVVRVNIRGNDDATINKPITSITTKNVDPGANQTMIIQDIDVNYDRDALKQKILANKLSKITAKTTTKPIIIEPVSTVEIAEKKAPPQPGAKKMKKKILLEIEEDKKELETIHNIREKIFGSDDDTNIENINVEETNRITPRVNASVSKSISKTEKTEKTEKMGTIVHLEPDEYIEIGNVKTSERLGKSDDVANASNVGTPMTTTVHKVSSYYLNNREIFVNFINSLFEQYTQ